MKSLQFLSNEIQFIKKVLASLLRVGVYELQVPTHVYIYACMCTPTDHDWVVHTCADKYVITVHVG